MEFYFGTAVGFLLASLMLNATYGWAAGVYPVPVLVMSLVGFIVGKIRQRFWTVAMYSRRYFKYRRWIFLLLWLLCALSPYCGMKTYYLVNAAALPIPPGWTRTEFQTAVLSYDSPPGFYVRIERYGNNVDNPLDFYRQYFESKGWSSEGVRGKEETFDQGTHVYYRKSWSHGILIRLYDGRYEYNDNGTVRKKVLILNGG